MPTQWLDADWDHPSCVRAFYLWTGAKFQWLQVREVKGECPDIG